MVFVLLTIISSLALFVIFKIAGKQSKNNFPLIFINYLVALAIGILLLTIRNKPLLPSSFSIWLPYSLVIGTMFIIMFFLIARSAQLAGIGVTAIASKTSVIFPILFSIFADPSDNLTLIKLIGILLALVALALTIYKKNSIKSSNTWLPLILFVGMGFTDSLIKQAQLQQIDTSNSLVFSTWVFLVSAVCGLLGGVLFKQNFRGLLNKTTLIWGAALGLFNLGSIYFIMLALNTPQLDGSIIFGVISVGVVVLSTIVGWLFFNERITKINFIGIALAILAIILLST